MTSEKSEDFGVCFCCLFGFFGRVCLLFVLLLFYLNESENLNSRLISVISQFWSHLLSFPSIRSAKEVMLRYMIPYFH